MKTFEMIIALKRLFFEANNYRDALIVATKAKRLFNNADFVLIEYDQRKRISELTAMSYLPDSSSKYSKGA